MQGNREIWRSIDGYGNYEVSTRGRVRNATTGRTVKQRLIARYQSLSLYKDQCYTIFKVHRLVAQELIPNLKENPVVDHIDCQKENNHVSNLRWATWAQNAQNRSNSSSVNKNFKGISLNRRNNKWMSRIRINGKLKHLGYFDDVIEAAKAYDRAAKIEFKEFAKLNCPDES